jgi:hypothetical protein
LTKKSKFENVDQGIAPRRGPAGLNCRFWDFAASRSQFARRLILPEADAAKFAAIPCPSPEDLHSISKIEWAIDLRKFKYFFDSPKDVSLTTYEPAWRGMIYTLLPLVFQ